MIGFSDIYSDNDDSEVVIEDNSDHSHGRYSARCSKSGKSDCIFQVPKQIYHSAGLNQEQQWVILGDCGVSAPMLQTMGLGTINCTTLGFQMKVFPQGIL